MLFLYFLKKSFSRFTLCLFYVFIDVCHRRRLSFVFDRQFVQTHLLVVAPTIKLLLSAFQQTDKNAFRGQNESMRHSLLTVFATKKENFK